jgi:phenylalanyl-tRNA synthetase beta chain
MLDVRGEVPEPFTIDLPIPRVRGQIGVDLSREDIAGLIEPIGFLSETTDDVDTVRVTVPTNRPDVRRSPFGIDDVIEEVARTFGYANIPRHVPTWPQPGHLTSLQRGRRLLKDVLVGLGSTEGWTDTFVSAADHAKVGLTGPAVRVSNPLTVEEPYLRRSLLPGLLEALAHNADRRQAWVRLFEVGVVFSHPEEGSPRVVERAGAGGLLSTDLPGERELLGAVFALEDDDAQSAVAAWHVVEHAFRLQGTRLLGATDEGDIPAGLHPSRCAQLVAPGGSAFGVVGEVDPGVASAFGLMHLGGGATLPRRVGWLELDLGMLLNEAVIPRHVATSGAVSRFPSSDIDLALVVDDVHPADAVGEALRDAAGELVESVSLFDVYRGPGVPDGARSLAFRLRFVAPDHTLTDEEVGTLRTQCIEAAERAFAASLR